MKLMLVQAALATLVVVALGAALALVLVRRRRMQAMAQGRAKAAMAELRKRVLLGTAAECRQREDVTVWGCVMELARPDGVASLVALEDGHTSLYTSTGGGILGGQAFPKVAAAARAFCLQAIDARPHTKPATEIPFPAPNFVAFYVLTPEGPHMAQIVEADLANGWHPLSPLFVTGHKLITELRLATTRPNPALDRPAS